MLVFGSGCSLTAIVAPAQSVEAWRLAAAGLATEKLLLALQKTNPGDLEVQYRLGLVALEPLVWLAVGSGTAAAGGSARHEKVLGGLTEATLPCEPSHTWRSKNT
jgi:hypothetical protein